MGVRSSAGQMKPTGKRSECAGAGEGGLVGGHRGCGVGNHPVLRVYVFAYDRIFPCVKSPLIEHGSNVKGFIVTKSDISNTRIFS